MPDSLTSNSNELNGDCTTRSDSRTAWLVGSRLPIQLPYVVEWLAWAFLSLGVMMRLLRYLLHFPLWSDEAALAANLLNRGYLDLLRPLDYQQVAPPLFLWIELSVVRLLGFTEWSLRAFPLACSVASLFLFRHVARRLFGYSTGRDHPKWMLLFAVAIFSVSYYPLRHGVEVKQYASDLLVSLGLIALALEWVADRDRVRWLWWLAAVVPIAVGLSHPATFVAGGISIALVPIVWSRRAVRSWVPFVGINLALIAAFAVMFVVSTGPQIHAADEEGILRSYWSNAFPPLDRPLAFIRWFVAVHAGQLFAYPAGGADVGSGLATFACFIVGISFLIRSGRLAAAAVCLAPFGLTFVAAALERYPYGGYARTAQHLAPIICLLAGAGAARLMTLISREQLRRSFAIALLAVFAVFGGGLMVHDVVQPFRTEHDRRVCEFARWFWHDKAIDAELVCAFNDLNQPFFRQTYLWRGIAQYLCNQRIYSPQRHGPNETVRWDQVSDAHPLRCVVFSRPGLSRDEAAFDAWLANMRTTYDWVGYEENDFHKPHEHEPDIERIALYEFVPRDSAAHRGRGVGTAGAVRSIEPLSN